MGNHHSSRSSLSSLDKDELPKRRHSFSRAIHHLKEKHPHKDFDITPEEYEKLKNATRRASTSIYYPSLCYP
ncbi:unnamed protein product [Adineta ricciae]|uniref:Uncharacterized protein n=1 Tax=Adineta ricciae TaxID=249248 RepID=A0A815LEX2_ADIRI|nr:unnamed protein product [Adineta ricciae]CAF1402408.1 unnamed protein product [Adineta ricciae]